MAEHSTTPDARIERGRQLHEKGRFLEAADAYVQTLGEGSALAGALRRIADDALSRNAAHDARALLLRAHDMEPDNAENHHGLAKVHRILGNLPAAVACCRRAVECAPDWAPGHVHLAECLLAAGFFEEGFHEFEWRRRIGNIAVPTLPGVPIWDGCNAAGRSLLVAAEQGYGDTFQFARFLAPAAERGVRVTLAVPPPLHRLCENLPAVELVISRNEDLAEYDIWAPLLSLPHLLRAQDVSAAEAYMEPSATALASAASAVTNNGSGPRIGVSWRGRPGSKASKSISSAFFDALAQRLPIRTVSLQKESDGDDRPARISTKEIDACQDFDDTAGLIANLDLIVTADTAVAHLAGALGKPVWVLLSHNPDWRWMQDRGDSPWYPSAKLFRQREMDDWQPVFEAVEKDLSVLCG